MEMHYPISRKTNWGYKLPDLYDFTPHFFSIIEAFGEKVLSVERISQKKYAVKTNLGQVVFGCGHRKEPYGFFVNNKVFHWQNNLFDLQLKEGRGAVTWERMAVYHEMLKVCNE
jgi:hypothetical protein